LKEAAGRLEGLTVWGKASAVWIIRFAVPHGCMGIPRHPVFTSSFMTDWRHFSKITCPRQIFICGILGGFVFDARPGK
jgi:hypothetical protein